MARKNHVVRGTAPDRQLSSEAHTSVQPSGHASPSWMSDWNERSNTEVVPKRGRQARSPEPYAERTSGDDTRTDRWVPWQETDDATVRMPFDVAEALIQSSLSAPSAEEREPLTVVEGPDRRRAHGRASGRSTRDLAPLDEDWGSPPFPEAWLPPAPRIPSELANTVPPVSPRARRPASSRRWVGLALRAVVLVGLSFAVARVAADVPLRQRIADALRPVWQAVQPRVTSQAPRAAPSPRAIALPLPVPADAAPALVAAPSEQGGRIPVVSVEDLPLLAEDCAGAPCPATPAEKARPSFPGPAKRGTRR